ncbi:hypothetical protein MNBD_GAMMA20-184 [hydrothermal vent metagenome]|uniref:Uncharacterized protein n=1 Tax=hydrothermal vent metagenome TaxID=652676 RepID=A0A3B1AJM9_9ZZZZ
MKRRGILTTHPLTYFSRLFDNLFTEKILAKNTIPKRPYIVSLTFIGIGNEPHNLRASLIKNTPKTTIASVITK